jgi:hypothetical protein
LGAWWGIENGRTIFAVAPWARFHWPNSVPNAAAPKPTPPRFKNVRRLNRLTNSWDSIGCIDIPDEVN